MHIKEKDGTTKFIASLEGRQVKTKKRTIPRKSSLLKWQPEVCQRAPNPPKFAQPRLSRSNGGHPQREGTILGVFVPIWHNPSVRLQIWVCLICHFALISPYSNGAVQIRLWVWSSLCLEPADRLRPQTSPGDGALRSRGPLRAVLIHREGTHPIDNA